MSREEILITRYGEMLDMIACLGIHEGDLIPKSKNIYDNDKAFELE